MTITILSFAIAGYLWADFLTTRDLQKGNKSALHPLLKFVSGIVAASLILQILTHLK